jgi:hypothetical protein
MKGTGLVKFLDNEGVMRSVAARHIVQFVDDGPRREVYLDEGTCLETDETLDALEVSYMAALGYDVTNEPPPKGDA